MKNTRPDLADIRRRNKRRERLSTYQENFAIASMFAVVVGIVLVMTGVMNASDVQKWCGVAGLVSAPVLACVSMVIDTFNN